MSVQSSLVQLLVWFSVNYVVEGSYLDTSANIARMGKTSPIPAAQSESATQATVMGMLKTTATTIAPPESGVLEVADSTWPASTQLEDVFEGRMRKKKYKKYEVMMLTKLLMGMKVALLGVVLPLAVVAAKVLSWKAVTLSLLAYMLAKIVFVKNLFMSKQPSSTPSTPLPPPQAPPAPIIIHSSAPASDNVWKRQNHPRIHLQPEVHVHQAGEDHHTPSWTWAEEGRDSKDPHQLAFGNWLPKLTQIG